MSIASHMARIHKKRSQQKARNKEVNLASGLTQGTLTLRHESGKEHPIRGCPQCTIERIHLVVLQQAHDRQAAYLERETRIQAWMDAQTGQETQEEENT